MTDKPAMYLYIAVHHHKFGESIYPFYAKTQPDEEKIITECGIDYEPEEEEYIEVIWLNDQEIPVIKTD